MGKATGDNRVRARQREYMCGVGSRSWKDLRLSLYDPVVSVLSLYVAGNYHCTNEPSGGAHSMGRNLELIQEFPRTVRRQIVEDGIKFGGEVVRARFKY